MKPHGFAHPIAFGVGRHHGAGKVHVVRGARKRKARRHKTVPVGVKGLVRKARRFEEIRFVPVKERRFTVIGAKGFGGPLFVHRLR